MKALTLLASWTLLILAVTVRPMQAEDYPTHPVRIIVPFPAGQATDIFARVVAEALTERFGVSFVVDNRGGAGGIIGMQMAAGATPDGYTLLVTPSGPMVINPSLYNKMGYDPVGSFAPITMLGLLPLVAVVPESSPVTSIAQLVALAKQSPGSINYASSGTGSAQHLTGELFKWRTGIDIVHVPYKGSAPAMTDLLSGRVDLMFDTVASSLPNIKAGKLRPLAVTTARRTTVLPEVPAMAEAGVPKFEAAGWSGMLAPAGTPPEIVKRLHTEVVRALDQPAMSSRIVEMGMEPMTQSPEAFAELIKVETAKWADAVRLAGIQPE